MNLDRVRSLVRDVPDFPQPGVLFRDLSPALANGPAFGEIVAALAQPFSSAQPLTPNMVLAVEARGFVLGGAVAHAAGVGLVCARKPGKLPVVACRAEYTLEYGTAALELPAGVLGEGHRVLIVDDVLATGGTLAAACELVEAVGAAVAGIAVVIEIEALAGRGRLPDRSLHALLRL